MKSLGDTIVALSSGQPPAAVAIVRSSGPLARFAAERVAGSVPGSRVASLRTLRHPLSGDVIDTALVLCFPAPATATGEDIVEFQCHGGRAVVTTVLDALTSIPGLRLAEPGEFTRRALANGRIDLTEAEGLADLLAAETEAQRRAALAVAGGALSRQIEAWQLRLLDLHARAEAAIDYVGDEEETGHTAGLQQAISALAIEIGTWLARPRLEPLRDGIRVVLAGPPNAGKSSLLNALVGHDRAIVTPVPGTTRDSIEVPLAIDGLPFVFVDTAGLRDSDDTVEAMGIERSAAELRRADILVWMGEPTAAPVKRHLILVQSKSDLAPALDRSAEVLSVSARTGENISALTSRLREIATEILPREDQVSLNDRQRMLLHEAAQALQLSGEDLLLTAERLRSARVAFDRLTGRAGVEDVIDSIFARFCLGK